MTKLETNKQTMKDHDKDAEDTVDKVENKQIQKKQH